MTEFKEIIENTRKYVNYLEKHYDNVQKAFNEFTKRTLNKNFQKKYEKLGWELKLYDDFSWEVLKYQIEQHDISKLFEFEFTQYRDRFYPSTLMRVEISKKLKDERFALAVEHHKQCNFHHWESRVGKEFNELQGFKGAFYAFENAMDWIAMAYEFNETPLNKYYLENKNKIILNESDRYIIETVYQVMMDKELDSVEEN